MSLLLSKITKERKLCYLAGDFNINLLQVRINTDILHYFDELKDKNFTPLITSPTRVTSKTKTLIMIAYLLTNSVATFSVVLGK